MTHNRHGLSPMHWPHQVAGWEWTLVTGENDQPPLIPVSNYHDNRDTNKANERKNIRLSTGLPQCIRSIHQQCPQPGQGPGQLTDTENNTPQSTSTTVILKERKFNYFTLRIQLFYSQNSSSTHVSYFFPSMESVKCYHFNKRSFSCGNYLLLHNKYWFTLHAHQDTCTRS